MFHAVEANKSTSTAESCFTMNSNRTGTRVSEMALTCINKLGDDLCWRSRAVNKYHIVVSNVTAFKLSFIIFRLVESDDSAYFKVFKYLGVAGG